MKPSVSNAEHPAAAGAAVRLGRAGLAPRFPRLAGWVLSAAGSLALAAQASACAVCMGGDNEQIKDASNSVLWSLLALVGFIFVATGLTAWYLVRKAAAPIPPHLALIDSLVQETAQD